ncbi:DeoR/GlpR transcriptional regulator [Arsenicitalea aurantiaca]|uniref:DeoR/GlpR transcriptional regulator n=1 Tax=Arsenicitalea aurantiaca TaxID=1783274 RepID=A0A433X5D0_9HYPH|nr:DeoR/GlpR family DNA-binding transcription regulator [Arsenicitalea aurantiaca]RUT29251.1 DeoR/GlpR transcriptional regulator [Arsenicitalea aurantiaca]
MSKTRPEPDPRSFLPAERLTAIADRLAARGVVRVDDIATELAVSTETVRRDLKALAQRGQAEIVRGGARLLGGKPDAARAPLPPVDQRSFVHRTEKEAIGREAAGLVADGQVVLLDGGSTTAAVARSLAVRRELTVITNNLVIAQEMAGHNHWRIHVVGGELSPSSMSLVGLHAIRELRDAAVDIAFLGAAGVTPRQEFTSADPVESELKRAMMAIARKVVIVADATKLHTSGFSTFASAQDVDLFITTRPEEGRPDAEALSGIEIIYAE